MSSTTLGRPAAEPTARRNRRTGWDHRPAMDGLRVVAVYLVVAYHGGLAVFEGGFIGVDLFFVLSGFLVTSVLLQEYASQGRIRLTRFYARRMRRLLPAAAVAILGTAAAFVLVAPAADRLAVLGGARSAFLYVANWHFLGQADDYFAAEEAPSPFLHFWSLAIEEQFYLAFPLLLIGLIALARRAGRRPGVIAGGLAALCALSLVSQVMSARSSELRAYYATDARLYQLLAGATLAALLRFWPSLRGRFGGSAVTVLALVGLGLAASSAWSPTPSTRGMVATVFAVAAIGSLEGSREGNASRALGRPTLTYLGRISYGTYLWHWPVIVLADRVVDLSPVAATALSAVLGTALAALSNQIIETPVRSAPRLEARHRLVAATGLAVSLVAGLVLVPAVLRSDRPTSLAAAADTVTVAPGTDAPVPADVPWEEAQADTPVEPVCLGRPATDCVVVTGDGPHLHLVGDSHAKTLLPLFERLATERGYTFSATASGACPWQRDLLYRDNEERTERCIAMHPDWYDRVIPELDPDVVVLFHRAFDDPAFPRQMTSADPALAALDQATLIRTTAERTIEALSAEDRRVVILEPVPMVRAPNPTSCLSGARLLSECAFQVTPGPMPTESVYRYADQLSPSVWSVDLDAVTCPDLPVCMPMVDGLVVRRDRHHLTGTFARHVSDGVGAAFDRAGIFDGL